MTFTVSPSAAPHRSSQCTSASLPLGTSYVYRADVTLSTVQFNPQPSQALGLGVQPQDLVLRNNRPVTMTLTPEGLRINAANFVARDTTVEVSGTVPFRANAADEFGFPVHVACDVKLKATEDAAPIPKRRAF